MAPFPSEYASQMMHTAQILREKCPSSCDIFLECGGLRIAAHRIVVAAFSRVLAARVITLHPPVFSLDYLKVSGDVVQRLVAYMYKPNNALRDYDNMQELYNCAQLLDIPTAVHDIEKYMSDNNQTLQMECLPKNQVQSLQLSNVESQILSEIFHLQNSDPHEHQEMDGIIHSSSNVNNNENADNESDSNDTPAKPYTSIKPRSSARLSAKTVAKNETLTNYHSETLIVTSKSESILKTEQDNKAENMIVVQPDQPLEQPFEQPFEQPSDEVNMNSKSDPEQVFVEYRKEDGSYSCPHCNASFSYEDFLPHVQEYKVVERPYVCDKCSKTFKYAKHLKAHMRTHSNVRPYVCEICKAAFKDQKHLSRHSRLHSGEKPFGCSECSAAFAEKDRLARHIASCHDKRRPHACSHAGCTFRAAHLHGLKEHERTHIPPEERESSVCDVCGKELKGARSIRMHMLQHHGDDLTCIHCEYKSKYKNCLKSHMLRVHGVDLSGETTPKQHMCETCGFQSHFLSEYRRHVRRAHGTDPEAARPYACSFCAFRTASRSSLGMHERGHRGEAPFVCMQCPVGSGDGNGDGDGRGTRPAYTSQSALRRHERSAHSGPGLARPHRCPQCPAAYGELKNLTAHMYRHTGVKPFPCSLCPFATVKKARLVQHIRQAHGPEHVPAPQRNVHHAKHKTTNKTPANKAPGSKTKGSSQPFPPPLPPTTDPPPQLEMPSEIDQETAAAAVVMQSMASGEYLHQPQHLPPPQYQPLEHMDYLPQHQHQHQHQHQLQAIPVTDHQHQHIPVSDHQHQHIPVTDHQHQHQHIPVSEQLPNMAELTNYAPVYSQPHIGAEQEVIATTVSSASLVVTLPHHHHLHLHPHQHQQQQQHHQQQHQQHEQHNPQQQQQHNPQQHHQQQQQQQQLPPTTDPNHMLSTPLSSSFHTYTPQTTDPVDRTLGSQYRSEGILAGAAREAGLLAGGEIQEIQEENIQMPTQTSISGLDLSLQDSYSPSTSSNPSNSNLLPNSNVLQAIAINTNPNVSYSNLVITNSNPNVVPSNSHTSMVLSNANIVAANSNANVLSTSSISNAVPNNSNPNVVALRLYQP